MEREPRLGDDEPVLDDEVAGEQQQPGGDEERTEEQEAVRDPFREPRFLALRRHGAIVDGEMELRDPAVRDRVAEPLAERLEKDADEVREPDERLMRMFQLMQEPFLALDDQQLRKPQAQDRAHQHERNKKKRTYVGNGNHGDIPTRYPNDCIKTVL